jgi:hypothetical protein
VSEERPYFDLLPAVMHLRIQYLGVVALIEASKQKKLDTIESSVERLRMKMESPKLTAVFSPVYLMCSLLFARPAPPSHSSITGGESYFLLELADERVALPIYFLRNRCNLI